MSTRAAEEHATRPYVLDKLVRLRVVDRTGDVLERHITIDFLALNGDKERVPLAVHDFCGMPDMRHGFGGTL